MTVAFQSGYTLPANDQPLKHARIIHAGNLFNVASVVASSEVANYEGALANEGDTVDRWRPFSNVLTTPSNLNGNDWNTNILSVGSDGQTINEGTGTGTPDISQPVTFTAGNWVASVRVERQTVDLIRVVLNDGTSDFVFEDFNLFTETATSGASIIPLGNDQFELVLRGTAVSGTGEIRMITYDGTAGSYTGTNRTVKVLRAALHRDGASLRYDLFAAQEGDVFGIAAHNLWSSGSRITFEHDSNGDNTFTSLGSITPTNNSPIMFIFEPVTSARWRIRVDRGALPEIGVVRVAKALQMQQAYYSGATPSPMSRQTVVTGNISGSGQLMGRSKRRTILAANHEWRDLKYNWVRANLDGPRGLIQAAESEPVFCAWRPAVVQDVDYIMRAQTGVPQAQGVADLWSFAMSGEALAYE